MEQRDFFFPSAKEKSIYPTSRSSFLLSSSSDITQGQPGRNFLFWDDWIPESGSSGRRLLHKPQTGPVPTILYKSLSRTQSGFSRGSSIAR